MSSLDTLGEKIRIFKPGMLADIYNPSSWESQAISSVKLAWTAE